MKEAARAAAKREAKFWTVAAVAICAWLVVLVFTGG